MKIQSINQQNIYNKTNPNFKKLKYSKKTLEQVALTPKMLKNHKKLQKLSQIFDITIVKGNKGDLLHSSFNKFINEKNKDLTKKVFASLGAGLAIGTAATILSGSPLLFMLAPIGLPTLTYLLGNIAIKKLENASYAEPLFKVQLSKDGDFSETTSLTALPDIDNELSKETQDKICKEFIKYANWDYFVDIVQRTDENGNTLAHLCSSENLEYMYQHVAFNSEVLTKVFTTPNKKGERAIHRLSDETIGLNLPSHIMLNEKEKKALLLEKPEGCDRTLAERWYEAQYDRRAIQMLGKYVGPKEAVEIREKSIKYYDNFSVLSNTQIEKMTDHYFQKDKNGRPYYENLNSDNFIRLARLLYESEKFDSLHTMMMHKDTNGKRMLQRLLDQDFISIHKDLENFVGKENVEIINEEIISTKCEEIYNKLKKEHEKDGTRPMLNSETRYLLSLSPERYKEVLLWKNVFGENSIKNTCTLKDNVQDYINTFKDKDPEFLKTILKTEIPIDFASTSISTASYFSDSELRKDLDDILGADYMFNEAQEKKLFEKRKSVLNQTSPLLVRSEGSLNEILSAFAKREDKRVLFYMFLNQNQKQPLLDYYMDVDEDMVSEVFKAFYNYPEYLYKIITYSPNNILPVHTRFSKKLDEELIKIIGEEKFAELLPVRKEYKNTNFIEDITRINANKETAFHRVSDSETLVNMIQALKPDTNGKLEQALLQRNKDGLLPIHKMMEDKSLINVLIEQLQDKPNFLKSLLTSHACTIFFQPINKISKIIRPSIYKKCSYRYPYKCKK